MAKAKKGTWVETCTVDLPPEMFGLPSATAGPPLFVVGINKRTKTITVSADPPKKKKTKRHA